MRRCLAVVCVLLLLTGCSTANSVVNHGLAIRERLLSGSGCSFEAVISADYGDEVYTFTMDCYVDVAGDLSFSVKDPATISGVTGVISESGGKLTFDNEALAFEMLADGQITPVSAPWVLVQALKGGYLKACEKNTDGLHLIIDDSYKEDALQVDIYTDTQDLPVRGEILWKGVRVVSLDIRNFTYL